MVHVCMLIGLLAMPPTTLAHGQDPTASDIVVIDGRKNPSQIPEWLAWEHGFMRIAMLKGKESSFTQELKDAMSPEEFDLLEREALSQDQRMNEAIKEAEPLQEEYRRGDQKDAKFVASLVGRIQEINVRYRRATLDARDRVLQGLRPESQSVVLSWIGDLRGGIVSRVPTSELERWRAPE
jgi:hypothetical protein